MCNAILNVPQRKHNELAKGEDQRSVENMGGGGWPKDRRLQICKRFLPERDTEESPGRLNEDLIQCLLKRHWRVVESCSADLYGLMA